MGGGKDFFAGYGVHTFAVQIPIASLRAKNSTIGVWASVDRPKVTTRGGTTRHSGSYVQVNRLGNPLVNEVVIPTGLKDAGTHSSRGRSLGTASTTSPRCSRRP